MLFTTPNQFAVLALCIFAGWLFGLASRSGGARSKARLREVEAEHAAYRKDAEARIAAAEADRDRVARAAPVTASTMGVTPAEERRIDDERRIESDRRAEDERRIEAERSSGIRPAYRE